MNRSLRDELIQVISPVLDFYLDNRAFTNQKLKNTNFTFKYPELKAGLEETIRWQAENKICKF